MAGILRQHKISCVVNAVEPVSFSTDFLGSTGPQKWALRLNQKDWVKAKDILTLAAQEELKNANIPSDYYLFDFSNDELLEIIKKYDEWNEFDVQLATHLLNERGVDLQKTDIEDLQEERVDDLSEQKSVDKWLLFSGYLLACFGGYISIIIGLYLLTKKQQLPNGEEIYFYDKNTRVNAKVILAIGSISFLISLLLYLPQKNSLFAL